MIHHIDLVLDNMESDNLHVFIALVSLWEMEFIRVTHMGVVASQMTCDSTVCSTTLFELIAKKQQSLASRVIE